MGNSIEKWKYFGLDKKEVLKYSNTVSLDNLKVLKAQCIVMAIFLFIVGPVLLLLTNDSIKGYFIVGCAVYFTVLFFSVRHTLFSTKEVTASRADFLVFLFSFALYFLCDLFGQPFPRSRQHDQSDFRLLAAGIAVGLCDGL